MRGIINMITSFDVYLITTLNSISYGLLLLVFLLTVSFLICGVSDLLEDLHIRVRRKIISSIGASLIASLILFVIVPTTKQAWLMIGLPRLLNNEKVQQLPEAALDAVNSYLNSFTEKEDSKN
jgi:hypothetical protein